MHTLTRVTSRECPIAAEQQFDPTLGIVHEEIHTVQAQIVPAQNIDILEMSIVVWSVHSVIITSDCYVAPFCDAEDAASLR